MMSLQPVRFDASLPPTPCTEEMRKQVEAIARKEGVSLAQVQRTAISLFLLGFGSNANNQIQESELKIEGDE